MAESCQNKWGWTSEVETMTLTELCQELRNWFDRDQQKWYGEFTISNGAITWGVKSLDLKDGQYFRIIGSTFNDGVQKYDSEALASMTDESFDGSVWAMAVPPSVIALAEAISNWKGKFEDLDNSNMSPFQSESFGGYSYSKGSGGSSSSGVGQSGAVDTWQSVFAKKLSRWRKL